MKVMRKEGSQERRVLTGLITSKEFLSRVVSVWKKDASLFGSPWTNKVAGWCVDYFRRYNKSPGKSIQSLFEDWAENSKDESVPVIERFLTSLSDDYTRAKDIDVDQLIDSAEELFNKNQLAAEAREVEELMESGRIRQALEKRDAYKRITLKGEDHINLFDCEGEIASAVTAVKQKPLVVYPGGLGKFFGRQLVRDSLVGIMGPEKSGKSYILLDIAWRAIQQGRKVAYFQVGDLSRNQIMERIAIRAARRPLERGQYQYPVSIELEDGEKTKLATVQHETRNAKGAFDAKAAADAMRKVVKQKDSFRLMVYPNASVSIVGIDARLESFAQRGWICDVCVIDYSDILAPVDHGMTETRDQINQTWTLMRSMSQRRNCLVVTATQASAAAYKATALDKSHFSNDKRKYAHITAMLAINQIDEEKELGVMRLNWLDVRSEPFNRKRFCYLAGCLALANPCVRSAF